jgi:flagellar FliJ protein
MMDFLNEQKKVRMEQSAASFRYSISWRNTLQRNIWRKTREIAEIQYDIDLALKKLRDATRRKKILEKLKEKQYTEWKREYNRKEQEFLDELAQNQFRERDAQQD